MRKARSLLFSSAMIVALVAGCSNTQEASMPEDSSSGSSTGTIPVSLTMTDDPPAGVSVLFFEVSLTGASLMPSSGSAVSLLNNNTPVQVDVTQLQALSAFLSTANVSPGTYQSLSLTFASPELVIFNASDQAIASTCAVGTVCQLTPTFDNSATVSFSTAPFPITVAANSPLGLLVDFHLNTVIQSDLSVNLGVSNGVTISELPSALPSSPPQFGYLIGTVQSVNTSQNQFTLQTANGRTFTIGSNSSTAYDDFPSSVCATGSISCLVAGQVVQVEIASVQPGLTLVAAQVTYLQAPGQQTAEGTIIGLSTSNGATVMKLILHQNPSNNSGLPLGGEASVSIGAGATFSIDANGFTLPAGLSFTGISDLLVGQNVQVNVAAGSLTTVSASGDIGPWGPPRSLSFTTNSVELEPSQMTGAVTAVDSSTSSFTLGGFPSMFFAAWPFAAANTVLANVETTSQTKFQGLSPENLSGLAVNDIVSVNGWLFPPASGTVVPVLAAETVVLRSDGMF